MLRSIDMLHDEALLAAVLGDEADPRRPSPPLGEPCSAACRDRDRARVVAVDAEDRARDLAAPGADQSRQRDDLAGAHLEARCRRRRPRA